MSMIGGSRQELTARRTGSVDPDQGRGPLAAAGDAGGQTIVLTAGERPAEVAARLAQQSALPLKAGTAQQEQRSRACLAACFEHLLLVELGLGERLDSSGRFASTSTCVVREGLDQLLLGLQQRDGLPLELANRLADALGATGHRKRAARSLQAESAAGASRALAGPGARSRAGGSILANARQLKARGAGGDQGGRVPGASGPATSAAAAPAPAATGPGPVAETLAPGRSAGSEELREVFATLLFPTVKEALAAMGTTVNTANCHTAAAFCATLLEELGIGGWEIVNGRGHTFVEVRSAEGERLILDPTLAQFTRDDNPLDLELQAGGFVGTRAELGQVLLLNRAALVDMATLTDPQVLATELAKQDSIDTALGLLARAAIGRLPPDALTPQALADLAADLRHESDTLLEQFHYPSKLTLADVDGRPDLAGSARRLLDWQRGGQRGPLLLATAKHRAAEDRASHYAAGFAVLARHLAGRGARPAPGPDAALAAGQPGPASAEHGAAAGAAAGRPLTASARQAVAEQRSQASTRAGPSAAHRPSPGARGGSTERLDLLHGVQAEARARTLAALGIDVARPGTRAGQRIGLRLASLRAVSQLLGLPSDELARQAGVPYDEKHLHDPAGLLERIHAGRLAKEPDLERRVEERLARLDAQARAGFEERVARLVAGALLQAPFGHDDWRGLQAALGAGSLAAALAAADPGKHAALLRAARALVAEADGRAEGRAPEDPLTADLTLTARMTAVLAPAYEARMAEYRGWPREGPLGRARRQQLDAQQRHLGAVLADFRRVAAALAEPGRLERLCRELESDPRIKEGQVAELRAMRGEPILLYQRLQALALADVDLRDEDNYVNCPAALRPLWSRAQFHALAYRP